MIVFLDWKTGDWLLLRRFDPTPSATCDFCGRGTHTFAQYLQCAQRIVR